MRLTLLAIALAIPSAVVAQTTGTISGTITSASTGAPLAASLTLFAGNGTPLDSRGAGSDGRYTFGSVAPGTYFLQAAADGHVRRVHAGLTCIAADCAVSAGTPIVVTAGATTTVDMALVPGGAITGVVRRAVDGSAPIGTPVFVYNEAGSIAASTTINSTDGVYSVGGLASGTYFALTQSSGFIGTQDYLDELYGGIVCPRLPEVKPCPIVRGAPIIVTAGATTGGIDFSLDAAGKITGTVTGVGEAVRVGTAVDVYSGSVRIAGAHTDESGRYTVNGLPTGFYTVRTDVGTAFAVPDGTPPSNLIDEWYPGVCVSCTQSPAGVVVTAGATTTVNFELETGARVSGTITLAPARPGVDIGVPGFPEVRIFSATGVLVRRVHISGSAGVAPGARPWQAGGLPAGTYYVRTASSVTIGFLEHHSSSGWWIDELFDNIPCVAADCRVERGTPVVVPANGHVTDVNIALDYGAVIRGQFPPGEPTGRPRLALYDARGVPLPERVVDKLGGTYIAGGLPAGTYYMKVRRDTRGAHPETLHKDAPCNGCSVTSGTPVALTQEHPEAVIDFTTLPSRGIAGVVRSSSGTPLSTITVEIFSSNGDPLASATTTEDGRYAVSGLNPGTYYARTSNQRGFVDVLYGGSPIIVAAGVETAGIDFSLPSGTVVSGFLTSQLGPVSVGHPMSGPTSGSVSGGALLFYQQDGTLAARAITDSLGRFETTLVQGTYDMQLAPLPGHARGSRTVTVGGTEITNADLFVFPSNVLTISPERLANAAVGSGYRQTLLASGGVAPITFSLIGGTLPPGLSLSSSGVLSGTPTASGRYTFTVAAEDSIARHGAREYTLDLPVCIFIAPASIVVPASGDGMRLRQSCPSDWTVSSDASWITASRYFTPSSLPDPSSVGAEILIARNTAAEARRGTVTLGSRVIRVFQSGTATTPPFGFLDTPANGSVVSGSVAVTGWALDDLRVSRVTIYRDPVAGEGGAQIYLGDATIVPGARPDVETAFPGVPGNTRAGYGYLLLSNMLPNGGNGTFNLYAYADDTDGNRVLLGARTIVGANNTATAPFGAIDTPDQGAIISGQNYVNFGWALTPQPKLIPFDGSTISVVIDGVPVGMLSGYNFARSDVSTLFPGLKNSAGPVGYRVIDTTALSDGLHTIGWVVTDEAGQATGIGSRYFTVQNSAWLPSLALSSRAVPPAFTRDEIPYADATTAVPPRIDGVDAGRKTASLATLPIDAEQSRTVVLGTQERLELALSSGEEPCGSTYEGYLSANGELRALPAGSSLARTGTFYWQPGPAFSGTYSLVFVRTACDGSRTKSHLTVRIR